SAQTPAMRMVAAAMQTAYQVRLAGECDWICSGTPYLTSHRPGIARDHSANPPNLRQHRRQLDGPQPRRYARPESALSLMTAPGPHNTERWPDRCLRLWLQPVEKTEDRHVDRAPRARQNRAIRTESV